jgi:uncharacterized protein involved in tolerance to divalent cations
MEEELVEIHGIESVYLRNGVLETLQESKLVLKTRRSLFQKIEQILKD